MNCEACFSFEGVSSDYRIVMAKIRLSLRKNATRTATTKHYDWTLLNNRDIRDKYVLETDSSHYKRRQKKVPQMTNMRISFNARLEAAAKCIPTKPKTKYRFPRETLEVREKRAHLKTAAKSYWKNPTNTCPKTKNGTISISRHISKGTDRMHTK